MGDFINMFGKSPLTPLCQRGVQDLFVLFEPITEPLRNFSISTLLFDSEEVSRKSKTMGGRLRGIQRYDELTLFIRNILELMFGFRVEMDGLSLL